LAKAKQKVKDMVARTFGAALHGVDAIPVRIEVSVGQGMNVFLVGLPDSAVRESLMRIEIAIRSVDMYMPRHKVVINLAPAGIQKTGTGFDLPITLGILAASEQLDNPDLLKNFMIAGEVGLDGSILPTNGVLPMAIQARQSGLQGIIVPRENEREASMIKGIEVFGASCLKEVMQFFSEACKQSRATSTATIQLPGTTYQVDDAPESASEDFSDVKGQEGMKRVMEIAAAGAHNLILIGPPGSSKTMLAKRMPSILPPLTLQESLETTRIHSVAGLLDNRAGLIEKRPFRSPHHTCSDIALSGGGPVPRPGEISMAHNGVLFMDELPEFKRVALEVLRQPMEERKVLISRAKMSLEFPANFMLVASMNPCPCGYHNHPERKCTCSPFAVAKYIARISGPLLDRIDLQMNVAPVSFFDLDRLPAGESSKTIRERVIKARNRQHERNVLANGASVTNANLSRKQLLEYCDVDESSKKLLYQSMDAMQLSARAYERILKVCRTIADLAGCDKIKMEHVAEAIHYRSLDRQMQHQPQTAIRKLYPFGGNTDEDNAYKRRII
jgi:magnesium chelatase family protein